MDFGKLPTIAGVDFSLPPDHPRTAQVLARAARPPGPGAHVHVGCPVWACRDWLGKVYPPTAKEKDFLSLYSRQFNCIELNTTHYRAPDVPTVARWRAEVPPGFHFCPKLLQETTHQHLLTGPVALRQAQQFAEQAAGLGDRLGVVFMQLPPYFGPDKAPVLVAFLRAWPRQAPLAVEFRHEAWFGLAGLGQVGEAMEELGVATVITDVAGRRDVLHQRLTSPQLVLRFVGNGLHPTDYQRADDWVRRLQAWLGAGLQSAYIFAHEPDNALAPELADYFVQQLNEKSGLDLARPRLRPATAQGSLF
jgi:uncharacterized protein YecE (DUF72 family)